MFGTNTLNTGPVSPPELQSTKIISQPLKSLSPSMHLSCRKEKMTKQCANQAPCALQCPHMCFIYQHHCQTLQPLPKGWEISSTTAPQEKHCLVSPPASQEIRTQQIPAQVCGTRISSANTKAKYWMSTSQALYLCPLCTSPLSLDLHFLVDIPAPRMVCGDADRLLKGKWTVTEIVQNIHCASWKWAHFGSILF